MKRTILLSLAALLLTWTASQFATILEMYNDLDYDVEVYTSNRRCGEWGGTLDWRREPIWSKTSISLCSGNEVTAYIIFPEGNITVKGNKPATPVKITNANRPAFKGFHGDWKYAVQVPKDASYKYDILPTGRSAGALNKVAQDANATAKGWLTNAAIDTISAGNPINDPKVTEKMLIG